MFLIDKFVITNIEVANIVCDVYNRLISWWLMHRGKLTVSCVLWTTDWYRGFLCDVESFGSPLVSLTDIWDSVWCWKLRVTASFVNRHLRFCVVLKASGHRVYQHLTSSSIMYCGKLTDKMRYVNIHLTSSSIMYCGKLTDKIRYVNMTWTSSFTM